MDWMDGGMVGWLNGWRDHWMDGWIRAKWLHVLDS